MDAVKVYYSYSMFLCGIPAIKVLGTVEDWELFASNLTEIEGKMFDCGVESDAWFRNIHAIVQNIVATLKGEDRINFWRGIFTSRNVGSGRQLSIDGWIIQLYRNKSPGLLESFSQGWAVVPFKDLDQPDVDFRSILGAFYRKTDPDGFISCHYGDMTIIVETSLEEAKSPFERDQNGLLGLSGQAR
jgi:hypothetical protein